MIEVCLLCATELQTDCRLSTEMCNILTHVHQQFPDTAVFLFGDFHFPPINGDLLTTANPSCRNKANEFLNLCLNFNLSQVFDQPTWGTKILDLLLTNSPDNVRNALCLLGLSDRKLINLTHSLPVEVNEPVRRTIKDYNNANFKSINQELQLLLLFYETNFLLLSTNENWSLYKNKLWDLTNHYILSLFIKSERNHPWYNKFAKISNRKRILFQKANVLTIRNIGIATTKLQLNIKKQ